MIEMFTRDCKFIHIVSLAVFLKQITQIVDLRVMCCPKEISLTENEKFLFDKWKHVKYFCAIFSMRPWGNSLSYTILLEEVLGEKKCRQKHGGFRVIIP